MHDEDKGVLYEGESNLNKRDLLKKYKSPVLVEYGSIAKLTQTATKTGGAEDGAAARMAVGCL